MSNHELPVPIVTRSYRRPRLIHYYPAVTTLTNFNARRKINLDIYNLMLKIIRDQGYYQNPQSQITGTYELKNNQRDILSLSLINYMYAGGAHGLTIQHSLTFDVTTGKSYMLSELFKPGTDYINRINAIIRRQIRERNIQVIEEFKTIRPDQDYYIADKSLVIYFQLYELTPYAFGFPYFPISVYEIQDIIDEAGPLGKMLY